MGKSKKESVKGILVLFCVVVLAVFSSSVLADGEGSEESFGFIGILEFVNLLLLIATIGLIAWQMREYTQGSVRIIWGYFLIGTLLLASIQLFILLYDINVIDVSDSTFHISWHLIFYLSMLLFFKGGKGLVDLARNKSQETNNKLILWGTASLLCAVVIFFGAEPSDSFVVSYFEGTILDTFGIHHFGAFVAALLVAFYMFQVRNTYKEVIGSIATPLLIFLALFGVFHLWELITESWMLIEVEESVIEGVEQIIAFPALTILLYGFYRSKQIMQKFTKKG